MLTREVSRIIPWGHRQSFDDDAPGGASALCSYAFPPGASSSAMLRGHLRSHSCKVTVISAKLHFLRRTLLLENDDMGPSKKFRAPSR